MKRLYKFFLLALLLSAPAAAEVEKSQNVPFRQDSGLISAEYYLATGKYAQALDVAGKVLARHPNSADAYTYIGFAHAALGDMKKAEQHYRRALALEPAHMGANRYLAAVYLSQDDLPRALEQLQALRAICGSDLCDELIELENDINAYKKKPAAEKP